MSAERRLRNIGVLALGALTCVGCFHIDPPEGRFSCDPGPCPRDLICAEDHLCRREPSPPDLAAPDMTPTQPPDMLPTEMPDMAPCPILYVSASGGNDANSGCSTDQPKRSIGAALSALAPDMREVHVCRGEYAESGIALTLPLYGGYDCTTWQRTATYGYPSFDGTNETVLVGVGVDSAVTVKSGSVVLDGVTVKEDAAGQMGMTRALYLIGGNAKVRNSKLLGAITMQQPKTSFGVDIDAGANVDLSLCHIDGGAGTPSIGVQIEPGSSGKVHVWQNSIDGGTGNDPRYVGSVGIVIEGNVLTAATETAIEDNIIYGGRGNANVGGDIASMGIDVWSHSRAEIVHNTIDAGVGNGVNITVGIHRATGSSGPLVITRNRIFGGVTPGTTYEIFGLALYATGELDINNNMIQAGDDSGTGAGETGIGIFDKPARALVRHNTVFVRSGQAMRVGPGVVGVAVENNIFGSDNANVVGTLIEDCASSGVLQSWRNNLSFGLQELGYGDKPGGSCAPDARFTTDDAAQAELGARCTSTTAGPCAGFHGTLASGNVNLSSSCAGDSGCIARVECAGTGGCAAALFATWDPATAGRSTLFGSGWQLQANDPCSVVRSSLDLSQPVPVDLYGVARSSTPSMGAHQLDGACTP